MNKSKQHYHCMLQVIQCFGFPLHQVLLISKIIPLDCSGIGSSTKILLRWHSLLLLLVSAAAGASYVEVCVVSEPPPLCFHFSSFQPLLLLKLKQTKCVWVVAGHGTAAAGRGAAHAGKRPCMNAIATTV